MSKVLREILQDPKKAKELKRGISELQGKTRHTVIIGGQEYQIEYLRQRRL